MDVRRDNRPIAARWSSLALLALPQGSLTMPAAGDSAAARRASETPETPAPAGSEAELPPLHLPGEPYVTPRAGQGFSAELFGYPVQVWPDDRRRVSVWSLGATWTPGLSEGELLPYGALYFWRRPDDDQLLRATLVGLYNDVFYARSPAGWGPFETVLTLETFTPPIPWADYIDGERQDDAELYLTSLRAGIGVGYRRLVAPGKQDNLFAATLLLEPGYSAFDDASDTADDFVVPQDTFEPRLHAQVRWDALERNLLELPHQGFALGLDGILGKRTNWEDWGPNGSEDADAGEDYSILTGYVRAAGGLPGLKSDRHRLIGSIHAGVAGNVDRFSAPRVGGGPQGDDYFSLARPVLPGAAFNEFAPEHYAVAIGEYRYEPLFFGYVGLVGSLGWLDRERLGSPGARADDGFASIGLRLTSGFVGNSRLQIEYHYSDDLLRDGDSGGHTLLVQLAKCF